MSIDCPSLTFRACSVWRFRLDGIDSSGNNTSLPPLIESESHSRSVAREIAHADLSTRTLISKHNETCVPVGASPYGRRRRSSQTTRELFNLSPISGAPTWIVKGVAVKLGSTAGAGIGNALYLRAPYLSLDRTGRLSSRC